jgi:GntR family transcriptional regulator, transcriptional repressor for pyruvate dehydrogenase complex
VVRVTRQNLSQAVAEQLRNLIRDGEFRPGERLPTERGLMEMFDVGRNTVREAVQTLVANGILDVRPGRGTTVIAISASTAMDAETLAALLDDGALSDLYDLRRLLEVEVAARAAERATAADIEEMDRHCAALLHAYNERLPTWADDIAFHSAIARASGNVIYLSVLKAVTDKLVAARKETQHVPRAVDIAISEHAAILEAIKRHDPDEARQAMAQHVGSAIWALQEARRRARQARRKP